MNNQKYLQEHREVFRQPRLYLKEILNAARRAPLKDWPPDEEWIKKIRMLKTCIEERYGIQEVNNFWKISLKDLINVARIYSDRLDWVIELCADWAEIGDHDLPELIQKENASNDIVEIQETTLVDRKLADRVKGIAHWLVERLAEDVATQVGTSAHPIAAKSAIWLCGPDLQNMAVTHRPAPRFVLAHRIIRCSDWRCS